MRALVCGGRDFNDAPFLYNTLHELHEMLDFDVVIHGAARGADTLAGGWAHLNLIPVWPFPADWAQYGKRAGSIRNQWMIEHAAPDICIAFKGGSGTRDMIRRALAARVTLVCPGGWYHHTIIRTAPSGVAQR